MLGCRVPLAVALASIACTTNTAPSRPVVSFQTDAPTATEDLVVVVAAEDPDGDAVAFTFAWSVDGQRIPSLTTDTVPADTTRRGEQWTVTVTASDGIAESEPGTASVTIGNLPPAATVTLAPEAPQSGEAITATAVATDPDGDPVSVAYRWLRDGRAVPELTGDTVPGAETIKGDRWRVEVTPNDGVLDGPPATAEVVVLNGAPEIRAVTLSPAVPTVASDVFAAVDAVDRDGDALTLGYAWTVDGAPAGQSASLSRSRLTRGAAVQLTVTASDGTAEATPFVVGPITVGNAAPTALGAQLAPAQIDVTGTLTCTPVGLDDLDGDTVTPGFRWLRGGVAVPSQTGATLDASVLRKGDTVTCQVIPNDGLADGAPVDSNEVTVGNAPPVVLAASVSAESIEAPITLAGLSTSDPDGDPVTVAITWFINDVDRGQATSLPAGSAARGDRIRAAIVPSDGTATGDAFLTAESTVGNRPPVVTAITLGPASPNVATGVTGVATTSDPDGDAVEVAWTWYVDDGTGEVIVEGASTATLDGGVLQRGDVVRAVATPIDPFTAGAPFTGGPSVTIGNAPPTLSSVSLSPGSFDRSTPLITCVPEPGGFDDPDGDPASYSYAWRIGGVDAGTGPTRTGAQLTKGQKVQCTAIPSDGTDLGTPVSSAEVTVGNAPPRITAFTLSPSVVRVGQGDVVTATVTTTDPDPADTVEVIVGWKVNGLDVDGVDSTTLDDTHWKKGDLIEAIAVATDGTAASSPFPSQNDPTVRVGNARPTIVSTVLTPAQPATGDDIKAVVTATDPDGDALIRIYRWSRNGIVDNAVTSDTFPFAKTGVNDVITVQVTVTDGTDPAPTTGSAEVTVRNAPPTAPVVAIVPPRPSAQSLSLLCILPVPSVDPDPGDIVSQTFRWKRNGQAYGDDPGDSGPVLTFNTNDTVPFTDVKAGDTWTCEVTASDGTRTSVGSATIKVWTGDLTSITSGDGYSCGLDIDGHAVCWGLNDVKQASPPPTRVYRSLDAGPTGACGLEVGSTVSCWGPSVLTTGVPSTATFRDVQVGAGYACALTRQGDIACWGDNSEGQRDRPGGQWRVLGVGPLHACAIGLRGRPFCWGFNVFGQATAPDEALVDLALGSTFSCGLRPNGTMRCWGQALANPPGATETFVDLTAGPQMVCGIKADDTVKCYAVQGASVITTPPRTDLVAASPGTNHVCGVATDGAVVCWGDGTRLQLQPPLLDLDIVGAGETHMCGAYADGQIVCWGDRSNNRLTPPDGSTARALALGVQHTCAIRNDGQIVCWGLNTLQRLASPGGSAFTRIAAGDTHTCAIDTLGTLQCWGDSSDGKTTVPPGLTWVDVTANRRHTCGITSTNEVRCWGGNGFTQSDVPAGLIAADIAAGEEHTCAVQSDQGIRCWGQATNKNVANAPAGKVYTRVVAGDAHSCALTIGDGIECWGEDVAGKLNAPQSGVWIDLVAGPNHTCATDEDGAIRCWGRFVY